MSNHDLSIRFFLELAFVLGAAMPRGVVSRDLQRFLEPLTTNFLVPLYFIYSGLNTRLDGIDPAEHRTSARHHHADAVHDHGDYGRGDNADGLAPI